MTGAGQFLVDGRPPTFHAEVGKPVKRAESAWGQRIQDACAHIDQRPGTVEAELRRNGVLVSQGDLHVWIHRRDETNAGAVPLMVALSDRCGVSFLWLLLGQGPMILDRPSAVEQGAAVAISSGADEAAVQAVIARYRGATGMTALAWANAITQEFEFRERARTPNVELREAEDAVSRTKVRLEDQRLNAHATTKSSVRVRVAEQDDGPSATAAEPAKKRKAAHSPK